MRLRHILLFLALICCFVEVEATEWSADNLPIPYLENRTRYVSDPDGILSEVERDSADYYLGLLKREKQVQSLFVIVGHVKDGDAFRMAQDLGNKLGIGDKETRRGLVVVIAADDRKYFIAPGMGLESELTDVDCDDIARACIVTNMRENMPGKAVMATSRTIYNKVLTGKTGVKIIDEGSPNEEADIALLIFLTLLFFSVPLYMLIRLVLVSLGIIKPKPDSSADKRRRDDDWFPPFIFGGGGGLGHGGGFSGGSFGGGSFGGGGSGGSW